MAINPTVRAARQAEALTRAVSSQSVMNYAAIYEGFLEKGIPESEILPRENVFTFNAWKALGRSVKKGEHGVKVVTWVTAKGTVVQSDADGQPSEHLEGGFKFCRTTTVFHVSQTEVRS